MRKSLTLLACLCVLFAAHAYSVSAQRLPPRNYEDRGACPFECCTYREWSVEADTTLYRTRSAKSRAAFRVKKGERVTGLTGVVVTLEPGRAVAKKVMTLGGGVNKIRVAPGDTLYLLHYMGEGVYKIWFRGRLYEDHMPNALGARYDARLDPSYEYVNKLSEPKTVWWMKVRNRRGQVGWTKQNRHFGDVDACG